MAKEPVKANLFRFVTLRNPQLIDEKEKDPGFVFHPDESKSAFYTAVKDLPDDQKPEALRIVSDGFTAYKTREEVRKAYEKLYAFSSWLMRNKSVLSFNSIVENSNGISKLTSTNEHKVWDNLIYQTINRKSVYVREACIQLLIANKFLTAFLDLAGTVESDHKFTEGEKKEFTRRAYASVVISKVLFSNSVNVKKTVGGSSSKTFKQDIDVFFLEQEIKQYKTLAKELKKVEQQYNKDIQATFDDALTKHNNDVEKIINEATPTIIDEKDALGNIKQIKTYPDLKVPEFSFKQDILIDGKYLEGKISDESLNIIKEQGLDLYTDFEDIYTALAEKSKTANEFLYETKQNDKDKTVSVGGTKIALKAEPVRPPYCFTAVHKNLPSGEFGIGMKLATDYNNPSITNATFQIKYDQTGTIKNGLSVINVGSISNTLKAFFQFDPILVGVGIQITFSGEFTLNNGKTYTFSATSTADAGLFTTTSLVFDSCAKLKDDGTGTGEPTPTPIEITPVYGVTNLGIADFRRVEQEVCCYVPGEVSHIENILAREYKERETRSLNSVEITSEQTREKEVENLTDTTTTERNEMQSEVASVLNEDESQNYGANASVNGKFPSGSYSVGAYADFSSSSSNSNSNSQSQTYAQEVTERAMERIVQKVSSKRTTRILKEFEETNTHGFDNTKGENHITGVYRWVDKIYKNSLINYGKRLMYEFAIPEPAKFFKEALYKQVENQETDSAVILPEPPDHPSIHGMHHAGNLNESNYQSIAAHYGSEVNAAPELYNYTGTSLTKSQVGGDGGNKDNKAPSDTIKVPNGYRATGAKTSGKSNGFAQVSIAGLNLGINSGSFIGIWPHYTDEVPVSAYFEYNWITNVNIVVRCERTTEYFTQWQNETFAIIMEAYEQKLREYNEAVLVNEVIPTGDSEKITFNPLFNRSIEKREIKRIAIELLAEQKGHDTSKDNYNTIDTNGIAKVNKTNDLQVHASTVKFFEQAFDWEIMAYLFYPYFYADEKDWKELFQSTDAADPIFQAFLQSGMARAVIPVRSGFEDAVNWYMETGEVWNGQGLVIDQDDDLYVSVAEEMQVTEGVVEDTWETRLPTALTIVQAESAALREGGLPCFCEEHQDGNTIEANTDIIGGDDGVGNGGIGKFVVSS